MAVFAGWSYDEIILPMFDYHDLFARGMGADAAERRIWIARQRETLITPRDFDLSPYFSVVKFHLVEAEGFRLLPRLVRPLLAGTGPTFEVRADVAAERLGTFFDQLYRIKALGQIVGDANRDGCFAIFDTDIGDHAGADAGHAGRQLRVLHERQQRARGPVAVTEP